MDDEGDGWMDHSDGSHDFTWLLVKYPGSLEIPRMPRASFEKRILRGPLLGVCVCVCVRSEAVTVPFSDVR